MIFETPGGGGFGDPSERDPEKVAFDLSAGVISDAAAKQYTGSAHDTAKHIAGMAPYALSKFDIPTVSA